LFPDPQKTHFSSHGHVVGLSDRWLFAIDAEFPANGASNFNSRGCWSTLMSATFTY
jgi:hypothetical protein